MNEKNIKVLIVEDEFPVAETIRIQLAQLGYVVVGIADNAKQAMQLFEEFQPELILLDLYMPTCTVLDWNWRQ